MYHNAFVEVLLAMFAMPEEAGVRKLIHTNDVFVNWFYSLVLKYPYDPSKRASFWTICIYGHLYKILVESQKLKMGIFDDSKSVDPKLRKIFDDFLAPKIVVETKEYSKERANMSDIIENEDDRDHHMNDQGESDEPTRKFTDTHFPTDFKMTLADELKEEGMDKEEEAPQPRASDDDGSQGDKGINRSNSKALDELAHWKELMAYSNRQIESFVGKKNEPGEDSAQAQPKLDGSQNQKKD